MPLLPLLLPLALQLPPCGTIHPVSGTVRDGGTGAPLGDVVVQTTAARTRTGADGAFRLHATACDTLRLTRLGYAPRAHVVSGALRHDVAMRPLALPLAAVRVTERGAAGNATYTAPAADARLVGGTTAADLASTLPFVVARTAGGRTALSVRASRAEQVVVVLDGMPLNDPASGTADPGDIPLVAIAAATVVPGSDVGRYGSGATGGVLALSSAGGSIATVTTGSLGRRGAEGAWSAAGPLGRVRVGAAYAAARDDFTFRNVAAAPPADTVETRVNNDFRRLAGFLSAVGARVQLLALHTDTERGLAGPMNVRAFDRDRGRTVRTLARLASAADAVELQGTVRRVAVAYRSADLPEQSFRVRADAADVEVAGVLGRVGLRGGLGVDRFAGTRLAADSRTRGFAAATSSWDVTRLSALVGLRADLVEGHGAAFTPSVTLSRPGEVTVTLRAAQGFRLPTFYDLYLASPQRITAGLLRPERVTHDLEVRAATARTCGGNCEARAELAAFERRTRDAIVWFPGNVGWSPQNVPVERARGAEVHTALYMPAAQVGAWGGRYLTRLWDGHLEMRTPYAPYWSAGGFVGGDIGLVGARLQLRHIGRRPFVNGPALPELELPPATVVSGGLRLTRSTGFGQGTITLTVDDLADVRPELVRRYPSPGRTWAAALTIQP